MSCEATRERLSAYVDGELPPGEAAETAEHLASCAACAREYEAVLQTVQTVREGLVRHHAPDVLRARVRTALRDEPAERAPVARRAWRAPWQAPWRAVAAALVVAVVSSGLTLLAADRRPAEPAVADEVLASHIRSLMPEHLTDVRSSDQHNVKPWFNGRVDVAPAVPDLATAGFPLVGGRLDYVDGHVAAAVVYGRRRHVVSVYSWPAPGSGDMEPASRSEQGFNLVHWRRGGVECWAVSDIPGAELADFVRRYEAAGR